MSLRPRTVADIKRLLDRAERHAHTTWEVQFIEDIIERFEKEGFDSHLTENQWRKLWEIAENDG